MEQIILTGETVRAFAAHLKSEEKSPYTVDKYVRDVRAFMKFAAERPLSKQLLVEYKEFLLRSGCYANGSINSMLASLNSFLRFVQKSECRVAGIRIQKSPYCREEKCLGRKEYLRLVAAAAKKPRLSLILETLVSTGIRISELRYFTVEALESPNIQVSCKNKVRVILIPSLLRKRLLAYAAENKITAGVIFRTRNNNPVNRSNVWTEMKKLCEKAGVIPSKVFPHNLRKLFARLFYEMSKDIVQLADLLGHSSINTTRIYLMTTENEVRNKIEKLNRLFAEEKQNIIGIML